MTQDEKIIECENRLLEALKTSDIKVLDELLHDNLIFNIQKEALHGILTFLFDRKEIHRVVEIVDAENIASINLLKSAEFKKEGHFIENIFFKGKWGSEFQYAMLKREWDNRKQ